MGPPMRAGMAYGVKLPSDQISVTTTYVMWREKRLLNVSVLRRVRLSNFAELYVHYPPPQPQLSISYPCQIEKKTKKFRTTDMLF